MLPDKSESKICLACGKPIKGRSDKKFCDDYCRNNYNNVLKSATNSQVRNINNTLGKNRRILETLLSSEKEMTKATRDQLLLKGFSFKYITHLYSNKKGNTYFFCYEYGYLPLDNDWYLIVKRKEE
jgi:predicted nucleic acid-binding Zn ribbon protein